MVESDSPSGQPGTRSLDRSHTWVSKAPLVLESGDTLPEVSVRYETWGELNESRSNAVFVCHALSGDSHVARHDESDDPGWWDLLVGPGKAVDTSRLFVICSNVLTSSI